MAFTPQKQLAEDVRDFVEFNSEMYDNIYLEFEGNIAMPKVLRLVAPNKKTLDLLPHFSGPYLEEIARNSLMLTLENHVKRNNRTIIERYPEKT